MCLPAVRTLVQATRNSPKLKLKLVSFGLGHRLLFKAGVKHLPAAVVFRKSKLVGAGAGNITANALLKRKF
ncbi:hypothetical protein AAHH88_00395 [Candidatus Hodgkinia cicadicola]